MTVKEKIDAILKLPSYQEFMELRAQHRDALEKHGGQHPTVVSIAKKCGEKLDECAEAVGLELVPQLTRDRRF